MVQEFWITYLLPHAPPRAELIDLHAHDPRINQLEDLRDLIIKREVLNHETGLLCRWKTKDDKEMKPSQCIESLLQEGIGTTEENALRLIVELSPHPHIPNYIWIKFVYGTKPAFDIPPKRILLDSLLPGTSSPSALESKPRILAHLTEHIFNHGYLKWSFLPFVSWKRKCGEIMKESISIIDILLMGEGICDDSPLCLMIANPTAMAGLHPPGTMCIYPVSTNFANALVTQKAMRQEHQQPVMRCYHSEQHCRCHSACQHSHVVYFR